jgi:hypothetical protein
MLDLFFLLYATVVPKEDSGTKLDCYLDAGFLARMACRRVPLGSCQECGGMSNSIHMTASSTLFLRVAFVAAKGEEGSKEPVCKLTIV